MTATPSTDARPATGTGAPPLTRADRRLVRTMRIVGKVHRFVLRLSHGRIGSRWFGGSDVLLLTVRGRRSGATYTVPLMSLPDARDRLVVASHGGVDREPQWWLNLLADPHAEVVVRGERFAVVAEQVGDDERQAQWDRFVDTYQGFTDYQDKVSRQIAVVRLRRT